MGKELVLSEGLQEANKKLAAAIGFDPMVPVLGRASKVLAVREWLENDEVFKYLNALQNTETGFMTDSGDGYDKRTLARAVTVALANDFQLVNNEFNIISGRFYGAKNGYKRRCQEFENDRIKVLHVTDPDNGDPVETHSMVTIPLSITYTYEDKETRQRLQKTLKKRIQLPKKSRDSIDTWLGKASKRLYQKLLSDLSGVSFVWDDQAGDGVIKDDAPPAGKVSTKPQPTKDAPPEGVSEAQFSPVEDKATETEPPAAVGNTRRPKSKNEVF